MKKILYTALLVFFSSTAFGQMGLFGITYNMGLPLGETGDYISNFSWRGIGLEGRGFINENISFGGAVSWNVFYEDVGQVSETGLFSEEGTVTLTGKQYRYINAFPILATSHYYFGVDGGVRPYIGVGVGAYNIEQRTEMGLYAFTNSKKWNFGFAPEVGIMVPISFGTNLYANIKYNYALENSSNSSDISWIGFNIGFAYN